MNFNHDFLHAFGEPELRASIKNKPEDFIVKEQLGFELSGSGEHLCLLIEKKGLNTNEVCKILSRALSVALKDISYSGIKDRQALTSQWFSLHIGIKREIHFDEPIHPSLKILQHVRNSRKIKRGSHLGNSFKIRLKGDSLNVANLNERLNQINTQGVPNYFGPQRFGKNQDNVENALKLFKHEIKVKDRFLRGIYLSAARAWLFNHQLSMRVADNTWNAYLPGDVMALNGTASSFLPSTWDIELAQRLEDFDIHPTAAMWGKGALKSTDATLQLETSLLQSFPELCQGLAEFGLNQERRPLRLRANNLRIYSEDNGDLMVEFSLGKGAYATSVLRELVNISTNEKTI